MPWFFGRHADAVIVPLYLKYHTGRSLGLIYGQNKPFVKIKMI